jgi:hypothetical protein
MTVRVDRRPPLTTVILSRPEVRNAVDAATAAALAALGGATQRAQRIVLPDRGVDACVERIRHDLARQSGTPRAMLTGVIPRCDRDDHVGAAQATVNVHGRRGRPGGAA